MRSPQEAAEGADVLYTDVWASMGQEAEREKRLPIFRPYQINDELLRRAKRKVLVLHCLPAHRGEEITEDVIEGPNSAVFQQAENRLHVQKSVLYELLVAGAGAGTRASRRNGSEPRKRAASGARTASARKKSGSARSRTRR